MEGFGLDRAVRRALKQAQALDVPAMPDPDKPAVDPVAFARACGIEPDKWQRDVLMSDARKWLLNCCRQSGKSLTTALRAAHEALYTPGALVLLVSPSLRQSGELFKKVMQLYNGIEGLEVPAISAESVLRCEFDNGSRIISLPGSENTVRGYSAATLVCLDEAARIPDSLVAAVRPTLATTNGRLIALSTPAGRRGWFFTQWVDGEGWSRASVKATDCPRITSEFLADERRELGEFIYLSEYECQFQDIESAAFSSDLIENAMSDTLDPLWSVAA